MTLEYDDHERYELRRCIALSLACRPYASLYMIIDFHPGKLDALKQFKYMDLPAQLLYDKIDASIACNENASDWELHNLITDSKGQIVRALAQGLEEKS